MLLHGRNIKRGRCKAHQHKSIGIGRRDEPLSPGNVQISMKKMKVYRQKVNNKKMIDTTDRKRRVRRCNVKDAKYVDIKKCAEDANDQKKDIAFGPAAAKNRQNSQAGKAAQRQ